MNNYYFIASLLALLGSHAKGDSIYDIAANNSDFSTLVTAVDAAGLKDTLSSDGTYTVFAPPNSAFAALPEELVSKLLDETWQPQLQDVLLYHVLETEVFSGDLANDLEVPTVNFQGNPITVYLDPPRINNSTINMELVDIEADNGVIHAVDAVLTPPSISNDIIDLGVADPDFSTLVTAVQAAGLDTALKGEGPFTLFAPTDDAFAALPDGTLDDLLADPTGTLTNILKYHVVAANAVSSGLESGDVSTLFGDDVKVEVSDSGVMVNEANVIVADVIASNGIIHVIDAVLIPPELTDQEDHDHSDHDSHDHSGDHEETAEETDEEAKPDKVEEEAEDSAPAEVEEMKEEEGIGEDSAGLAGAVNAATFAVLTAVAAIIS